MINASTGTSRTKSAAKTSRACVDKYATVFLEQCDNVSGDSFAGKAVFFLTDGLCKLCFVR